MSQQPLPAVNDPLTSERINSLTKMVDDRLDSFFHESREPARLTCGIRHGLLSPGKRLRPLITLLACEQSGGDIENSLDAACAMEMVHAASLIVDDLPSMDDARLRRGSLANHVVFGEGSSILAAIALLNEAYRIIGSMENVAPERRLQSINRLSQAVGLDGLAGGQERDIACHGAEGCTNSMADVERRHLEKTGSLFSAAAAIGADAAHAPSEVVEAMETYGHCLGLAYQAFDDLLDCRASSKDTGKDCGQDAGKSTVVSLLGHEGAAHAAERWLARAVETAEKAAAPNPSSLSVLAQQIGVKLGAMTT